MIWKVQFVHNKVTNNIINLNQRQAGFMQAKEDNNPEHLLKQGHNNQPVQVENQIKNQQVAKEPPAHIDENTKTNQILQENNQQQEGVQFQDNKVETEEKKEGEGNTKSKEELEVNIDEEKKQTLGIQNNSLPQDKNEENNQKNAESKENMEDQQQIPIKEQKHEQAEKQKFDQEINQLSVEPNGRQNDEQYSSFEERKKVPAQKIEQILPVSRPAQTEKLEAFKININYVKQDSKEEKEENMVQVTKEDNELLQQLTKEPEAEPEPEQEQKNQNEQKEKQIEGSVEGKNKGEINQQVIKQPVPQIKDKNIAIQQKLSDHQQQKESIKQEEIKQNKEPIEVQRNQDQPEQPQIDQQKQKQQVKQQPQQDQKKEQQNQPSEKQNEIEQNLDLNKPDPIRMTEQNEEPYQQTINIDESSKETKQEIVQFVQYKPTQNQSNQISKISQKDQSEPYKNIQNETLLKRIQELEETVKQLKFKKQIGEVSQDQAQEKTATQTIEKVSPEKKKHKQQVIHDQGVHGLVSELAKTESQNGNSVKKPILQEKRYKRRKLDLSNLMDKNMIHASNIFNLTIGEIINPNAKHEQQKESLKKQIRQLRQKVLKLQQDKRSISAQKPVFDSRRQNASTGKKQMCGKLVKVSELKASRISAFDDNDSMFKTNLNQKIETKSQRESFGDGITLKNKISSNSATQREERLIQKQKDNQNNLSFRVRRPTAKSMTANQQGQNSSMSLINSQQKIDTYPISMNENKEKEAAPLVQNKQWWEQPFIKVLQMPELPSPPSPYDSQEDLYTLGKLTFIAFGINTDTSKQMSVKKYKNCVYFNLGEKNNILWYFDGRFYIGEWQVHLTGEGQKSGQGFQYVPGKFIYQGQFKQGKRNKFGTIKILNKEKLVMYEGEWVDGNKCGQGKQIDEYGIKYWGEWKENKREGFGKLKLQDGDYYQGNFQKGIKTGFGKETFKNGDKYEGNYLANKFHGKGKYMWKNGSIYEGQFIHGIRSGLGKWRSSQTSTEVDEYEGQYQNDKKNGFGKYRWADGSEYEGFFKDDLKQGQGTIRYKNGKVAKLLWKNGQPIKKIFSDQEKNYRQNQKSRQKIPQSEGSKRKIANRSQTLSSNKKTISKDE